MVCSGAKAFLDLAATLELLESLSVAVIGYRTATFPSFYSRDSGLPLEHQVESPEPIAQQMIYQDALGFPQGIVVANPIPEAAAIDRAIIEDAIAKAMGEAEARGITGKAVTPFLLDPDQGDHRRGKPGGQRGTGGQQRPPGCGNREGLRPPAADGLNRPWKPGFQQGRWGPRRWSPGWRRRRWPSVVQHSVVGRGRGWPRRAWPSSGRMGTSSPWRKVVAGSVTVPGHQRPSR